MLGVLAKERRCFARVQCALPVKLVLRDNTSGAILAPPLAGQVSDMSLHGVLIRVPHIRVDSYHLFYSFNENQRQTIHLEITAAQDQASPIVIPSQPVWFDHVLSEPSKPFRVGMKFLAGPDDKEVLRLTDIPEYKQKENGNWLKRLFG